ncbi:zinc finger matrin-type protein 5 isoform X2 [Toxorhynchites rutilus septentrionalis]|uniref:zinc finger matrin-type protein 5 isoform X2 n=1 Tax=Toxorhynchites rutilus septentrionalis TaxID=329112 RepID=UPI002478D1B0|nr:zinc finger matrin-type protein 5 isoform X2 [Toxorhynchites rutilus septentrionalis]
MNSSIHLFGFICLQTSSYISKNWLNKIICFGGFRLVIYTDNFNKMGKKYYCDYCHKHIQRDPNIVRRHNEGIPHGRNKAAYYERFKDTSQVLREIATKKPCRTLLTSQECSFGAACRYSHYRPDEIVQIKQRAASIEYQKSKRTDELVGKLIATESTAKKFVDKLAENRAKECSECKQFWTYPEELKERNVPPSLQEIDVYKIDLGNFAQWG